MLPRRLIVLALVVLAALALLLVAVRRYRSNAAPVKIAEGVYAVESRDSRPTPLQLEVSSFALWRESGRLRAVIDIPAPGIPARDPSKPHRITETLEMNSNFAMRRFRFELENAPLSGDGALACAVKLLSLDCESTFAGDSGKGSIKVRGGYAAQFGAEMALLDFPWFFTTLLAHGDRTKHDTALSAVTISFDGQTPDTMVTGRAVAANAEYLGSDTIQVLGHAVKAHKFHVTGGRSRDLPDLESTVWVSERGLLLAADWSDERIEIKSFTQQEKLIPELAVEDEQTMAIRRASQFRGLKYLRLQSAAWVEPGGQQEKVYLALRDLGWLEVEEHAYPSSDGKQFLTVKVTDAGKAAAAHWSDSASAWDFAIAQQEVVGILTAEQSKRNRSTAYTVSYRWKPNELGNRLKDDLPPEWAIPADTTAAKAYLAYAGNEWKVQYVQTLVPKP